VRLRPIVGWALVLLVGLPILALATLARTIKTVRDQLPHMAGSDPFDGHPPQGVVFECRKPQCGLAHKATVNSFSEVEDRVRYYCGQGHQAIARFPAADDATWPPDEQPGDE